MTDRHPNRRWNQAIEWDVDSYDWWASAFGKSPERKLLVAILHRAVLDLLAPSYQGAKYLAGGQGEVQANRLRAFEFLYSPSIAAWGCRWICEQLCEDGEGFRLELLRRIKKRGLTPERIRYHHLHYRNLKDGGYKKRCK